VAADTQNIDNRTLLAKQDQILMPRKQQSISLENIVKSIEAWAQQNQLVGKVWVFGSRVRHEARPDSDIDLAIEIDLSAAKGSDASGGFATWSFECQSWSNELQARLPFKVDVQQFLGARTPNIKNALNRSSALLYKKDGFRGKPVKMPAKRQKELTWP
jgi:predicted nucleotidyltransferase